MRIVKLLFVCHLAALVCGLGALLIIAPYPELWHSTLVGVTIFGFVLRYAALFHILFGAATMFLFGLLCVGTRKTFIFLAVSMLITLSLELLSTHSDFFPGVSSSLTLPGINVVVLVPYSLLLSWFYMGFTSYLLASNLTSRLGLRRQLLWSLVLGTYFLMTWNLALNTALAHERVSPQLSLWQEYGSSFGLPMHSLLAWTLIGLLLFGASQFLWRTNLDAQSLASWLPFGVYTANTAFVMVLSLGVGLWFPACLSALFVLFPESLVLIPAEEMPTSQASWGRTAYSRTIWIVIRLSSLLFPRRKLDIRAEGLEYVPSSGPLLIAARHFHFVYDGYILIRVVPRRLHTIVALDWLQSRNLRLAIELACSLADWPVVLRSEQFHSHEEQKRWAYSPIEVRRYLRQVTLASARLLRSGEALVIFPEGYPNIDPHPTPKADLDVFLPFRPGFIKFVERAEKDGKTRVAIIPAGFTYTREPGGRWHTTVRFGSPRFRGDFDSGEQLLHAIEKDVRLLSVVPSSSSL